MAFVDMTNFFRTSKFNPHEELYPFLYNVDMAVGPGAPNRYDDVMLVQYFMNRILPKLPWAGFDNAQLVLDGKFGRQTANWILSFQQQLRKYYHWVNNVVVDGRVDKHPPGGRRLYVNYMIRVLNMFYVWLNSDIPFDNIPSYDPGVPPVLMPIFRMQRTRG